MFLTTHATASILIGQHLQSSLLGFFVALGGHFILDVIPHGDYILFKKIRNNSQDPFVLRYILTDVVALFLLTLFFYLQGKLYNFVIIFSLIGGLLPDIFVTWHIKTKDRLRRLLKEKKVAGRQLLEKHSLFHQILSKHEHFHRFIHFLIIKKPLSLKAGVALQVLITIVFIYLAF